MLYKQNYVFIVFTVTVLQQGRFNVETQRCINIETTTIVQPNSNLIVSTLKSQCQHNFQIQPYFNVDE